MDSPQNFEGTPQNPDSQEPSGRKILAVASQAISKAQYVAENQPPKKPKWTKHSFQINEETLRTFIEYSETLGKKKYEALEEALTDYFLKNEEVVQKINQIKSGKL